MDGAKSTEWTQQSQENWLQIRAAEQNFFPELPAIILCRSFTSFHFFFFFLLHSKIEQDDPSAANSSSSIIVVRCCQLQVPPHPQAAALARNSITMAALTMAASSLFVAAPAAVSFNASSSYSSFSSVRMAPLTVSRRLSIVAMAQNETKKSDLEDKVSGSCFCLLLAEMIMVCL